MKRLSSIILALAVVLGCSAPKSQQQDAAEKFQFRQDGTFKIVQITDTHLSYGDSEERLNFVFNRISDVIKTEKPDIIMITGDNVTSCHTAEMWDRYRAMLDSHGIRYSVTYGNHDREEQLSDYDLPQCFVNDPLCINTVDENGFLQDIAIPVISSKGDKTAAVLYMIDSGDYSPVATFWDYGWITHDQIHWYVEKSREFARANGNVPVPSYAFLHIPPVEFYEAYTENLLAGQRSEPECPAELDSGIFSAFEENGDVHGVFVGHDHDNDYVARIGGIAAVYGRCCFYKGESHVPTDGTRVIEIKEGDYGFTTWVREINGVADNYYYDARVDFTPHKATAVSGLQPGLVRTMYSDVQEMTEMETTATKDTTYIVGTPRMIDVMGKGAYGAIQEGYVYIPESGTWSFHISANDHGLVCIDDVKFWPTDYDRGQIKINVEKGYHPIKLYMKEDNGGGCWTKLMWRDQYNAKYHEIPADYFFHK